MSGFGYDENFAKELFFSPEDKDLMNTGMGPSGPGPAASVAGAGGRALRSFVADPVRGMFRSVHKARTTGFSSPEEMVKAGMDFAGNLVGTPGGSGGLGSGWRSRTLEALEKNSKLPGSASPQTWLSKLKGAGLPKDEVMVAEKYLGQASPGGKLSREQVAGALSTKLPELGVTKTTLGGAEWEAGQKRLDELGPKLQLAQKEFRAHHNSGNMNTSEGRKAYEDYQRLIVEQDNLNNTVHGKRPKWPQYNIEGLKDYKEEYFHAPLKEGGKYRNADMEMHFADKPDNLLYLKHQGTLEFPDGKKSTHMSTLQNDHAAEFSQKGKELSVDTWNEKMGKKVPEPIMLNTWWKHGLKSSIEDAVKAGHDYFTWDPAETQIKRFAGLSEPQAYYMKTHYDNNIPGFLKKEYGVEAKKVDLGSKEKDMLRRSGVSSLQDPFTGEMVPSDQLTIVPHRVGVDRIAYDIGRTYPAGHEGHLQPRRQGFGMTSYNTPEEAVTRLREHIKHTDTPLEKKEVWQIPITEEIKRQVFGGQFFSKSQPARPGGRNAEAAA
jgi:hypothetical protein